MYENKKFSKNERINEEIWEIASSNNEEQENAFVQTKFQCPFFALVLAIVSLIDYYNSYLANLTTRFKA